MKLGRKSWLAIISGAFVLLALAVLHTPPVQRYVFAKISTYLRASQGLELEAADFRYNLFSLSLRLRGFSARSAADGPLPPFLGIDSAQVKLRASGLFLGKLIIDSARLEGTNIQVVSDSQGRTNLPSPPEEEEPSGDPNAPLGFLISSLEAAGGSILFVDDTRRLRVELPLWRLRVAGDPRTFDHTVRFETEESGSVTHQGRSLALHKLALEAALKPGVLELSRLRLDSDGSQIAATGILADFANPALKFEVTARLELDKVASFAGLEDPVSGRLQSKISVAGPLDGLRLDARVSGSDLSFRGYRRIRLDSEAQWDLGSRQIRVPSLELRSPLGSVAARANLVLSKEAGASSLAANVENLHLGTIAQREEWPVQIASRATVGANVRWQGLEFDKAVGEAKIRLTQTQPEPSLNCLPVTAAISMTANGGQLRLDIASLEALGSRWQGSIALRSLENLGGELQASVENAEQVVAAAELFLGREKDSLVRIPVRGPLNLTASLDGTLDRPRAAATVHAPGMQVGELQDVALRADASYSPDKVLLQDLAVSWQDQSLTASGEIGLTGETPSLRANARISQASLPAILAGLNQSRPVEGVFDLEATVEGPLDNINATVTLSAADLKAYDETLGTLVLQAGFAGQELALTRLRLDKPLPEGEVGYLTATGKYNLASGAYTLECEANNLDFHSLNLTETLPFRGGLNLSMKGSGTADDPSFVVNVNLADVKIGDHALDSVSAEARLQQHQATLRAQLPRFNFSLNGSVHTQPPYPAEFEITADETDLSRLSIQMAENELLKGSLTASIKGSGALAAWREGQVAAVVSSILLSISGQDIRNEGPVELGFEKGELNVKRAALVAGNSRISMSGSIPLDASAPPRSLRVQGNLDVPGLLAFVPGEKGFSAEGGLKLDASIGGSLEKLDPSVRLTMTDGVLDRPDFKVAVTGINLDIEYEKGSARVSKAAAYFGPGSFTATGIIPVASLLSGLPLELEQEQGSAKFTLEAKDLELSALQTVPEEISGSLSLRVDGETSRLDDFTALNAKATFEQLQLKIADYEIRQQAPATISLNQGQVRIDQFVLTGPNARIEAKGTVALADKPSVDVRLSWHMDAGVYTLLSDSFKLTGDSRFELAASGDLQAPRLTGVFEMKQGQAAQPSLGLLAENLDVRITLAPDEFTIERFTGTLNGGALSASGSVGYSGTEPMLKNFNIDISAKDAFFNFPEGLKTQVRADLEIRSRDEFVVVGSSVKIVEGSYREVLELEGGLLSYLESSGRAELIEERSPFLSNLRYNISIDTESPLLIDNNLAKLATEANLRLVGTYYRPSVTGRVTLEEGGQLYLNEKRYFVERGVISFVNEARIEPTLDILAKTQVSGYEIDLKISGGGQDDFSATFTSEPQLSQPDIISVLLTGRTLEEVQGAELNVAKEQALSYLSGRVAGQLSRGAEETLGLSQVRIEPNLISPESNPGARLTVGEDITKFLRLIYSMNLTDSNDQIYIAEYDLMRRFNTRTIKQQDNSYRFEFRHDLRFGGAPDLRQTGTGTRAERRIGRIALLGNLSFPEERLSQKLGLEEGAKYDFFKVQKGIERLERFYEKQRHLEARIRVQREAKESAVDLAVNIDAGPDVVFVYEGGGIRDDVKKQVRKIWREGLFDAQRAEESVRTIRTSLVKRGFPLADVDYTIEAEAEARKRVLFVIEPGARFGDVPIVFEGAAGIDPSELKDVLKAEKLGTDIYVNPTKVRDFLSRFYRQRGYLDATIETPRYNLSRDSSTGEVVIPIHEGPLFKVASLEFRGNNALPASRLQDIIPLSRSGPYRPELLDTSLSKLEETYWAEGFNDVVIQYELKRQPQSGLVDVAFQITENRQSIIENVDIEGNHETSDRFVRGQIDISKGKVLDFNQTNRARKNLYDTGAYSLVDIETRPVESAQTIAEQSRKPVAVKVKLREVKPFEIRYGTFYDTERGPGFIADFANRNTLGSARVLGVRTRYDSDIHELRGYFSQPLVRSLPLKSNVVGFVRREIFDTFITDRIGFSVQQESHFRNNTILSYGYRFERTDTFDKDPESLFKILPFNVAPLTVSLTRETRDDFLDATRGSFLSHAFEWAPDSLGSDIRFIKYFGQYFKYLPLSGPAEIPWSTGLKRPRFVYAGGVRVGLAKGLGGQELIRTERFFAGGGTTIRGFNQDAVGPTDFFGDPTGGDAVFITNHELRFPAISIFDGVGFLDIGNVYPRLGDFDPLNVRKTAGLGLRVRTPYFLLRFDYGFKLDRKPGEGIGDFFISIGQAF